MSSNLNILFIYKFLTVGGVETVIKNRMEGLRLLGIHAKAWFLQYIDGKKILDPNSPDVFIGDEILLGEHLHTNSYDVLCTIDTEEVFPVLVEHHGESSLILESHSPYYENLEYLRFLGDVDFEAVFVPSEHQKQVVSSFMGGYENIAVVPNPLSEAFSTEISDKPRAPSKSVVAWIGRLDYLKNWKEFLLLTAHLDQSKIDFEVWLVGRSTQRNIAQDLFRYARKLGVLEHLRWYNNLSYTVIPSMLDMVRSSGGVVVSTSRGESFGMTIVEAMARACAVTVPDKRPFTEYVEHGKFGLVYPLGKPANGADCVNQLLVDEAARVEMGMRARQKVLARHSQMNALEAYVAAIEKTVDRRQV